MKFGEWVGFIAVLLIGYFLWQMQQLLLLIFTAIVLAIALNLLVRWLRKRQISRGFAILLSFSILFVILSLSIWLIVPPFVNQFQELVKVVPQGIDQFIIWLGIQKNKLDPVLIRSLPRFEQQDFNELLQQLQPIFQELLGGGLNVFYSSLGLLLSGLLLFALSLMFLASPKAYRQGFIRLFPAFYRSRVDEILLYSQQALENWLKGIVVNMGVVAIFTGVGLFILQIPLALSQSIIAGLLTFIPHLGLFLSVIPPIATIIALQTAPWKIWGVLILYISIQQIETNVLTKRIQARQVSLLPGFTILAQILFTIGFGVLGLILALPLSIISQICIREILVKDILNPWQNASISQDSEQHEL
ncbi:MAG: AI-2E family transporter [Microcystaceae cyanobacterium]